MRLIVTAGGTGGHIYPALSIIKKFEDMHPNLQLLFIGSHNRMEKDIIPSLGIEYKSIEITGVYRKKIHRNFKTIKNFYIGHKKAKQIIKDFNPDLVIGTGGYVTTPVIYAASKLGIKTMIFEMDAHAGIANKFLSRYATVVGCGNIEALKYFPKEKAFFSGNPRTQEAYQLSIGPSTHNLYGLDKNKKTVLIVLGSLGGKYINEIVKNGLHLFKDKTYQVIYATGKAYYDGVTNDIDFNYDNLRIVPFVEDMLNIYQHIDLMVSRAGASTLSEIMAVGLPSLLIPSPYVTNDHQTTNSLVYEKKGCCKVVNELELTSDELINEIDKIINDDSLLKEMKDNSFSSGKRDSLDVIYQKACHILK